LHPNAAAIAAHQPNDLRIAAAERHEIDQRYVSGVGLKLSFEDKSSRAIATAYFGFASRSYLPSAIVRVPQECGEAGAGIETR
jgi:hypothetical protein